MLHETSTVWISSAPGAGACCGSCHAGHAGQPCDSDAALPRCETPQLQGPDEQLQRALRCLDDVRDPGSGSGLVAGRLIKSLRIDDNEAELELSFPVHCGSAMDLADEAFHALRVVLQDTDIYVRHSS